jgi:gag-polypeptide of LTR copia-type
MSESTPTLKVNHVPRFDGTLFSLWKMQIMSFLEELNLLEVVENPVVGIPSSLIKTSNSVKNEVKEDKNELTKEQKELVKKSRTAYNILLLTLQKEQLHMVVDIPRGNAHGVWSALLNRYERKTVASKTQLRNQLYNNRLLSSETIDMYISRIKQLVLSLSDMGSQLSNDELLYVLFKGLPDSYRSLVDTLSTNDKLQFEEACTFIRDRQERISLDDEESEHRALHVNDSNSNQNTSRYTSSKNNSSNIVNQAKPNKANIIAKCETCKQAGHAPYYCPRNKNKKRCDYCRRVGHNQQECFYLTGSIAETNEINEETTHIAFTNDQIVF